MSWFYEALKQAEKARQRGGNVPIARTAVDDGVSLLDTLESTSPIAEKRVPEPAVISTLAGRVETPAPARVTLFSNHKEQADTHAWNNGFRHLAPTVNEEARLVLRTDPHGMAAEQFRFLRQKLNQEFKEGGVLMVTSAGKGDGKTLTSINLCRSFSDLGQSTLLVEVDVHRPSIARVLNCETEAPGVESAFSGESTPHDVVHALDNLWFHAAIVAKAPHDPPPLLGGAAVKDFLAWARQKFHWIVLDAPPAVLVADVAELLPLTDAAILVVRARNTPRSLLKLAVQTLGSHVRGVIFNETSVHSTPYYKYLDSYYGSPEECSPKHAKE